jgi:hypothetical protein
MRNAFIPLPHVAQASRAARLSIFHFPFAALLAALFLPPSSFAQDAPPPGMRITFLPPPMEGTLSLGIYEKKGALVRVMAREATEKDFIVGLNGLITYWDGKDDTGKVMPPGVYYARGYSVGAIDVEGVALHGNDWITDDDAPRPFRVIDLRAKGGDKVDVVLRTKAGEEITRPLNFETQASDKPDAGDSVSVDDGKVKLTTNGQTRDFPLGAGERALDATLGAHDRLWLIAQTPAGTEVRAYTLDGEFLRRLGYAPGDPLPRRILAARGDFAKRWSEQILLLEEDAKLQRVRSLALPKDSSASAPPAWETVVEKAIWLVDTFDSVRDLLPHSGGKPFAAEKDFLVHLIENPLVKNESNSVHVSIGFNESGSFLQSPDGLPLRRITDTPALKWAAIGREGSGKQLTIFQSDGAVVEEFRARRLAVMMAFDAGDYEWVGK